MELDIPLKQFNKFANNEEPWICYTDLVKYGAGIVEKKIKVMQERLSRLKTMQAEIERSEVSYHSSRPQEYSLPMRNCWVVPYTGNQECENFKQLTKKVILEIHQHGLQLGNIGGLLLMRHNNSWKQFLFVDVRVSEETRTKHPKIMHIPSGNYLCRKIDHSSIEAVWDWCLSFVNEEQIQLIIETELFMGNYDFSAPVYEQRCLCIE